MNNTNIQLFTCTNYNYIIYALSFFIYQFKTKITVNKIRISLVTGLFNNCFINCIL